MVKKFLRRKTKAHSKLGKGRKNKQKWKKPTGRDNKMREKRRGYGASVSIGYRTDKDSRGKLKDLTPVTVMSIADLSKVGEGQIAVIGAVGKKRKMEIANKAKEMKVKVYNMNPEKYLAKNEKKSEEKK